MEIYDTTLRDGTQSRDVNLTVHDKLTFAKALDDFGMDYIELGWPGSNEKDEECFRRVRELGLKARIAAFGSTRRRGISAEDDPNLKAITSSGAKTATIFGKSWLVHVQKQLRMSPEENLAAIKESIVFLKSHGLEVIFDAEHFFDGYMQDGHYSLNCLEAASEARCIVLCDTNGGMMPDKMLDIVRKVKEFFKKQGISPKLGIHCHNDSGCAVANTLLVADLVDHIQGTVNGCGERAGNADLCSILPALALKKGYELDIKLKGLKRLSDLLNSLANIRPNDSLPYVGRNAFSHKAGIHADGLAKEARYEHISPETVGNQQEIVLSDLSGAANVLKTLQGFGIKASKKDPKVRAMLSEIKELEMLGYDIGSIEAEKYLLAAKHFLAEKSLFGIDDFKIMSLRRDGNDYSECVITGKVDGEERQVIAPVKGEKGGPVHASYYALQKFIATNHKKIMGVRLLNYKVRIAESKGAESSVRVYVEYKDNGCRWATVGVNTNILKASLEAIEKGFHYYLLRQNKKAT